MARGKINKPLSTRGWKYSVLPSLRPPTLSRVVCCLWSTVLYSERPSYRHLCVSPLRLCGSAESDLFTSLGEGWSDCPVTTILFGVGRLAFLSLSHIYYTTFPLVCQEVFQKFLKNFFESCKCGLPVSVHPPTDNTVFIGSHPPWTTRPRLLTLLLYHIKREKSSGNIAQTFAPFRPPICAICRRPPGQSGSEIVKNFTKSTEKTRAITCPL